MPDLGPAADDKPADDKHCPACGSDQYWLYEVEKECKVCQTTWVSAWSLAHNDTPPDEDRGSSA